MNFNDFSNEQQWKDFLFRIKNSVSIINKDEDFFTQSLIETLEQALSKINLKLNKRFTLLFSAGADSTLLAVLSKRLNLNFEVLSIGFENSEDIVLSRKLAKKLNLEYREKILSEKEVYQAMKIISPLFSNHEFVVKELACFEYLAFKESLPLIVTGTGSEEIFAGYSRHLMAKDINKECWNGLENIFWKRDVLRVKTLSRLLNREVLIPFLDENVIRLAMSMPAELKIKDGFRKYIIAKALQHLGLEDEFAFRKKKAAQYGSGMDKFFTKLAKKNGLKNKEELFSQGFLNKF